MQNALVRLRELEEQVKTIPQLEVKISILTQQKNQLVESVGIEKERLREAERENGKLTARLKDIVVLEEDNEKLMFHIQELESIVDKVVVNLVDHIRLIIFIKGQLRSAINSGTNRIHIDQVKLASH